MQRFQGILGIRMLKGLLTIAEGQAKLHLKDIVDAEIAKQAMESLQLMMFRYGQTVRVTSDPKDVTYTKCLEFLKKTQAGIVSGHCLKWFESDQQIRTYVGTNLSMEHNFKIKTVVDMKES
jgi:hypothetical protein